jgi:hypothetical protein
MMATKQDEINKFFLGEGCLGKAAPDEPLFILRAQDCHAADLVEKWEIWARASGCPNDKVQEAMNIAEAMRQWPTRKAPD